MREKREKRRKKEKIPPALPQRLIFLLLLWRQLFIRIPLHKQTDEDVTTLVPFQWQRPVGLPMWTVQIPSPSPRSPCTQCPVTMETQWTPPINSLFTHIHIMNTVSCSHGDWGNTSHQFSIHTHTHILNTVSCSHGDRGNTSHQFPVHTHTSWTQCPVASETEGTPPINSLFTHTAHTHIINTVSCSHRDRGNTSH